MKKSVNFSKIGGLLFLVFFLLSVASLQADTPEGELVQILKNYVSITENLENNLVKLESSLNELKKQGEQRQLTLKSLKDSDLQQNKHLNSLNSNLSMVVKEQNSYEKTTNDLVTGYKNMETDLARLRELNSITIGGFLVLLGYVIVDVAFGF